MPEQRIIQIQGTYLKALTEPSCIVCIQKCVKRRIGFLCACPFIKKVLNDMKLKFKRPKKDTCNKCDQYKAQIDDLEKHKGTEGELDSIKQERDAHHAAANLARSKLQEDIIKCKEEPAQQSTLTFDLESTLPTPILSTNVIYYKRQLWTYNFGIHDCVSDVGHMYIWHEGQGSRGAQEISSCLQKHIHNNPSKTKTLVAWSDSCGGQNRNIKVTVTNMKIVQSNNNSYEEIIHKFLESGHSFLPNDSDFSDIEKRKKLHPNVYCPSDWCRIITESRRDAKKFQVVNMDTDDFLSTRRLEDAIINRKTTVSGE